MDKQCECGCTYEGCVAIQEEGGLCPACGCYCYWTPQELQRMAERDAAAEARASE